MVVVWELSLNNQQNNIENMMNLIIVVLFLDKHTDNIKI